MELTDQIRNVARITDIASQYTTLKQRGRKYVGLCPFHAEKDPSFTVDEEKQLFHCFGCGIGGDIFTLVMEKENLSFPEALRYLAQKYNIPLPEKRTLSPQFQKLEEQLYKINEQTLAFFKKNLFTTDEGRKALEYLKKRNISEETIQQFKIGYALNSWTSLLDFFQGKGLPEKLLEKAGLVIPSQKKEGYYDRFRGRVIFPIFNLSGKAVAFGGRTVFDEEPKYLNSPDTPLYTKGELLYGFNLTKDAVREKGEIILVEGYTDFTALFQAGITNIAASLGTSLTPGQIYLAYRFATRIIINYDSDIAGMSAAVRAVSLCARQGAQVNVLTLPEGLDPDSFLQKHSVDDYRSLLARSRPWLKVTMDNFLREGRMDIPEEKAAIVRKVVKEIEKIPDLVVRSEYLKQASEYLKVDEDIIRNIIQRKSKEEAIEEKEVFVLAEKRLLQILIENKDISSYVYAEMREEDFKGLQSEPIFEVLVHSFKEHRVISEHELNQKIEPRLRSSLSKVRLEKKDAPSVEEALDCLYSLRKISLQNKTKKIQEEIIRLEKTGDREKLSHLLQEKHDLTKQILSLG